jgi:hypothetical protein
MKTRALTTVAAAFLSLNAACAPVLRAQHPGDRPRPDECHVLANKLASDPRSEAFRQALAGPIAACGEIGAGAIAQALRAAKSLADSTVTHPLAFAVAHNRSSVVLDAALAVAEDRTASVPVRMVALIGVLRQHTISAGFGGSISELVTRPMGRLCRIGPVEHAGYISETALRLGYETEIVSTMRRIADDAGSPVAVRDAARCVADFIQPPPD